jgi:serine/threonine-protein kinase PknG
VQGLPERATVPAFEKYESLYLAIRRATDPDPAQRFPSMTEMADQLTGVLHEIVSTESGVVQPRTSNHFSPQRTAYGVGRDTPQVPQDVIAALSVPVVDPNDSGAALLATTSGTPPAHLEYALDVARGGVRQGDRTSVEIPLRLVRTSLEIGSPKGARTRLAELAEVIPGDWRLSWYSGQCALLEREFDKAAEEFKQVMAKLPGELAPKLAIAATAELGGAFEDAAHYYEIVWRTDDSYVSAAFGLARQRARADDRAGASAVLDRVPVASAYFTSAGATAIEILLDGQAPESLDEQSLLDADRRASALILESATKRATIRLRVLGAALGWLQAGNTPRAKRLLGTDFNESGVRIGMERCYRELAHEVSDTWERIALVERANDVRPRTRV